MRNEAKQFHTGMTIVELMVVAVIIAIIAAVAIPSMSTDTDFQVASAAKTLVADFEYAQSLAINVQSPVMIQFDLSTGRYELLTSIIPWVPVKNPITKTDYWVKLKNLPGMSAVSVASASFDGAPTLGFDALGSPYSVTGSNTFTPLNSGTIVLRAGTSCQRVIRVSPSSGALTVQ